MMLFMYWLGLRLHLPGSSLSCFKIANGANVGRVLIDIDHPRGGDVRSAQNFSEKALGCSSAAGLIQEEIECLAGRVNGAIQIHPLATDFDIGLIDPPGIVGLLQIRAATFIKFRRITLNPAVDGGVITDKPRSVIISSKSR